MIGLNLGGLHMRTFSASFHSVACAHTHYWAVLKNSHAFPNLGIDGLWAMGPGAWVELGGLEPQLLVNPRSLLEHMVPPMNLIILLLPWWVSNQNILVPLRHGAHPRKGFERSPYDLPLYKKWSRLIKVWRRGLNYLPLSYLYAKAIQSREVLLWEPQLCPNPRLKIKLDGFQNSAWSIHGLKYLDGCYFIPWKLDVCFREMHYSKQKGLSLMI